ncbi:bifunctional oligoribonuclease/PAP phosphatase NrnA [Candidatus Gracilibacteria bacterium]|nr:bifunctional oligoribonuclease/PAP phosphatase NrnA [Candidatus Gracilibacteria bacterium]
MSHISLLGKKIDGAQNILLINHIRMDPDAFGSLSGFYQILKKLGKNVLAINDEQTPDNFGFLGQNHIIDSSADIKTFNPELIISFDAASIDQLGKSYTSNKSIFDSTDFFVIDHHLSNPAFGQYNIIKTDYSSTCEIVYEIIEELNFIQYMDKSIATCIFTGMITDTNIFYNQNTTPNTHRVAAGLMNHGADFRAPIFEFYKKKSFSQSKLWGEILRELQQVEINGNLITYALVKPEHFDNTGTTDEDISGLINEFLSNMENSDVCFLLYPLKDGLIKASFRSKEMDVSKICQSYGGGGHKLAAGCSVKMEIGDFEKAILGNFS